MLDHSMHCEARESAKGRRRSAKMSHMVDVAKSFVAEAEERSIYVVDMAKNLVAEKIANVKKPEATVTNVDFKSVSRDSITFQAKVSVSNPYSFPIPIREISYTLKSATRVIASGKILVPQSLAGKKTTVLEVPVKVPYTIVSSLARDIGTDWAIDYELDLKLTFDLAVIGNITLPISTKGEIKLPTPVIGNIKRAIFSKCITLPISTNGEIKLPTPVIGKITLPFSTQGEIKLPALPGLFLGK